MIDFSSFSWPVDKPKLVEYLKNISDEKYRKFSKGLIPGEFEMIGVNIPTLKKIAKEIYKGEWQSFLKIDDEGIFELKFLKGQVIANIKDITLYEEYFYFYLQCVTDWSLCDSFIMSSKVISKNRERFFGIAEKLIESDEEFKNRVGFIILLDYFVDKEYYDKVTHLIDGFVSDKYYANMGLAWLLSVMYVKFPDETYNFLKRAKLSFEVKRLTVRKVRDSYRVSRENKERISSIN